MLGDPALPHLFFVEGGTLAVENALKTAFDWKSRHNAMHGRPSRSRHEGAAPAQGLPRPQRLHALADQHRPGEDRPLPEVRLAAHRRARDPLPDRRAGAVAEAERRALAQAEAAFAAHPHDIACFIAEPIQGEGGDNHMRPEFLQAMQELCHEHDALFVLDEVQTGCGMTGTAWAYQQLGLRPDVVAFGKKLQVCGIMAGGRVDEVPDNVFRVPSRINSTWGGNLTDMVRSRRQLEVIAEEGLIDRAAVLGKRLLDDLRAVPGIDNVRGRGLFVAFDLPTPGGPRRGAAAPARGPRARARRGRALDPPAPGVDHRGGRPRPGRPRDREGGGGVSAPELQQGDTPATQSQQGDIPATGGVGAYLGGAWRTRRPAGG